MRPRGPARERVRPEGPARLARLLAELADRDLLAGVARSGSGRRPSGWRHAVLTSRELVLPCAGRGVVRAGLKWVLVFPHAFVDVSDAWLGRSGAGWPPPLAGRAPTR